MGNLLDLYKLIIKTHGGVLNEEKYPGLRFSIALVNQKFPPPLR